MDAVILAILSGLFGLFCIGREVRVIVRAKQIRISNLFLIMYGITYGVVLSLWLYLAVRDIYVFRGNVMWFDHSPDGIALTTWWFFAAVVGYCAFRFVSAVRWGAKKNKFVYTPATFDATNPLLLERLQITGVICLVIGVVSFLIWVHGWGGYKNLFIHAAEIRNGSYGIKNPVAFFAKPAQIVATTTLIFLLLIKQRKNTRINVFLFSISVMLSLMYYLAKDGRMVMAAFFLIVLFMWNGTFEKKVATEKDLGKLAAFFVVFVMIVLNMDAFTGNMRQTEIANEGETGWKSIFNELAYIYVTGQTAVNHYIEQGSPWLIGHDVARSLFAWLPSAFTPKGLVNVWDYNTFLIAGNAARAQFPCDIISSSLYELGILGPVLMPAFWGIIINKLEVIYRESCSPFTTVIYCSLSVVFLRVVNYCAFFMTIAGIFHIFVAVVIFWLVSNVKRS